MTLIATAEALKFTILGAVVSPLIGDILYDILTGGLPDGKYNFIKRKSRNHFILLVIIFIISGSLFADYLTFHMRKQILRALVM